MLSTPPDALPDSLKQQAAAAFDQNYYAQAALCYEQLMELEPEEITHAWYLGLARLLDGQEAEAQLTWMMVLSEAELEQIEPWTAQLVEILQTEAERQAKLESWQLAWAVRQHLREIDPTEIYNLLHLVRLAVKLNLLNGEYLETLGLTELLQSQPCPDLDQPLLVNAIADAIEHRGEDTPVREFAEAGLEKVNDVALLLEVLGEKARVTANHSDVYPSEVPIYLLEICLRYAPDRINFLQLLSACYGTTGRHHVESVEIARRHLAACQTPEDRLTAIGCLCTRLLRTGLCWEEVGNLFEQQKALMAELTANYQPDPARPLDTSLLTFCSFYPHYLKDDPAEHRTLQNQLAALMQTDLRFQAKEIFTGCQRPSAPAIKTTRKLKIGYMARYMRQHPVGWLARWLMQHHDYERFDIYTYHLHMREVSEFTNRWFVKPVTRSARFDEGTWVGIAKHICQNDEIDILIDLDSVTYTEACSILALKPAPIQVSWLGFDATGIPAVDYFIADPYVLPDSAQDYYSEKIWRLPSTYLAVDGFEVGVPTLRRDRMDIPTDAVVYLSAQDGRKRHPEMMQLQLRILREVPNSYLLVKGLGDEASLRKGFEQAAEAEGISPDRLRFLERDQYEATHRANLGIADVVLDTYPYNGATTTLETLWMGIPIVTRTGQQWAARNSYTMLKNVGVEEGIAWTDEEYVEWGVRLGKDAALRQDIHNKLMQSRQTSPLWNTRQFAREMEAAYEQMWQIYSGS